MTCAVIRLGTPVEAVQGDYIGAMQGHSQSAARLHMRILDHGSHDIGFKEWKASLANVCKLEDGGNAEKCDQFDTGRQEQQSLAAQLPI